MDVSTIDHKTRRAVSDHGLHLAAPSQGHGLSDMIYVCTDPQDPVASAVGLVIGPQAPFAAYAPNPKRRGIREEIAVGLPSWEAGVAAVLSHHAAR